MGTCLVRSAALALLVFVPQMAAGVEPIAVGPHGDMDRLQIDGAEHFTAAAIRKALVRDLAILQATRTDASFYELRRALEQQIRGGYRDACFAEADVQVLWDEENQRLCVRISEGAQFRWSDVIVTGIPADVAETVRRWVVEPRPPADAIPQPIRTADGKTTIIWTKPDGNRVGMEKPLLVEGDTASLSKSAISKFEAPVRRALADHGYHHAKFRIVTNLDSPSQSVSLGIHVEELGPPAHLDVITVKGNSRDSREVILEFLGVAPGQLVTAQKLLELRRQLWECGRYLHFDLKLNEPVFPQDPLELELDLVEYPEAPPLTTPLDEKQQHLVRAMHWLNSAESRPYDVLCEMDYLPGAGDVVPAGGVATPPEAAEPASEVIQAAEGDSTEPEFLTEYPSRLQVAMSSDRGWLISIKGPHPLSKEPTEFTALVDGQTLHLWHHTTRLHYAYEWNALSRLSWDFALVGNRTIQEGNDSRFSIRFGAHMTGDDDNPAAGATESRRNIVVAPMVGLELGRNADIISDPHSPLLHLSDGKQQTSIDTQTGRLVACVKTETGETGTTIQSLRIVRDGMAGLSENMLERTKNYETVSDGTQPLSTLVVFAGRVLGESPADTTKERSWRMVMSLLRAATVRIEQRMQAVSDEAGPKFTTPVAPGSNAPIAYLAGAFLPANDELFSRETCFWKLGREAAALLAAGDPDAIRELIALISSEKTGPLAHLYLAEAVHWFNPHFAREIAKHGLATLDADRAKQEVIDLLQGDGLLHQFVVEIVTILREMPPEDAALLLSAGIHERHASQILAACGDETATPEDVAVRAFSALWPDILQPAVKRRLETLRGPIPVETARR